MSITADIPTDVSVHCAAAFKAQPKHHRLHKGQDRKCCGINLSSHRGLVPLPKIGFSQTNYGAQRGDNRMKFNGL